MTREEAINSFKKSNEQTKINIQVHRHIMDTSEIREREWYIERNEMAIKALEQDTCEDAISRQAVTDCFKKWQPYMATRMWEFEKELNELPSVNPQEPICEEREKGECPYYAG